MELAEVIYHMANSVILTVRADCQINQINLHSFKDSYRNNRLQRTFEFAESLSLTDFTEL